MNVVVAAVVILALVWLLIRISTEPCPDGCPECAVREAREALRGDDDE